MEKKVLILYSDEDEQWKEQVYKRIRVLISAGYRLDVDFWNENRFNTKRDRYQEFESSLNNASLIILLTSKGFLDSKIMQSEKVRNRLKMKQEGGFPVFVVLVNKCNWKRFPWMRELLVFPAGGELLSDLSDAAIESTLAELADQISNTLKFESRISEGILACLELRGVGPVKKKLCFEPKHRLNIITGDNGLGKTFLLECAWWALAGVWPGNPVLPRDDADESDVEIAFQLMAKSGNKGKTNRMFYDWDDQQWPVIDESKSSSGLIIYARVDGSFAVWDPVKAKIQPPIGFTQPSSPIIFNNASHIYDGIEEKSSGRGRQLCNGLIRDWVHWQSNNQSPFNVFTRILNELSTSSQEPLTPAAPSRVPGDTRPMPSLRYPYGVIPFIYAASSVQRIISLAYLMLWTWQEHKIACKESRKTTYKSMVVLIDEVESHLHPQWQRSIIPSLLQVKKHLDDELDIQFIITTHSPLVLASIEPVFEEEYDGLSHFDIHKKEILLKMQPFLRHGRVDNWYTSETFGLAQARSLEAEKAIREAKDLQREANPGIEEVRDLHCRLARLLSDLDTFWPHWTFFAEQHGVKDDSCTEET